MDQSGIPQLSEAVRASFEPIMKVLGPVRQQLAGVKDVVTTRPGYKYPPNGKPLPAIVVAVTPGTTPVQTAELEAKFARSVHGDRCHRGRAIGRRRQATGLLRNAGRIDGLGVRENARRRRTARFRCRPRLVPMRSPTRQTFRSSRSKMELTICVSPEAGWS